MFGITKKRSIATGTPVQSSQKNFAAANIMTLTEAREGAKTELLKIDADIPTIGITT
jgi:hypothetical protein